MVGKFGSYFTRNVLAEKFGHHGLNVFGGFSPKTDNIQRIHHGGRNVLEDVVLICCKRARRLREGGAVCKVEAPVTVRLPALEDAVPTVRSLVDKPAASLI